MSQSRRGTGDASSTAVAYAAASSEGAESEALELQARNEKLDELVRCLPLKGVGRILEVGCGTGALARAVARSVDPSVRIVGIDLAENHVETARALARDSRLEHVVFQRADLFTYRPPVPYDLVYARYVLMYLMPGGRDVEALMRMKSLAAPGGWVACIEADIDFARDRHPPPSPELAAALEGIVPYYRASGGIEWRAGIRLYDAMRRAGFSEVDVRLAHGRVLQGGRPEGLLQHDCLGLETLLAPLVAPDRVEPLTQEWRRHLANKGTFQYTPILVGVGTA